MFVNVIEAYILLYLPWSIAFPVLVFFALLCIYWKYNKADIEELLKHHKTKVNRFLIECLILSGIVIAFVVVFYVGSCGENLEIVQKNSLQVAYNDDFEDTRDQSWGPFPDKKKHKFNFSTNSAHSGIHSVKLDVDIEPFETNEDEEYGGIYNTNLNIHKAKAIKAWVLVPESEQVRGSNIRSHIMAYMMGSKGKAILFFGEEKKIVPGVWTQIFLDVFF